MLSTRPTSILNLEVGLRILVVIVCCYTRKVISYDYSSGGIHSIGADQPAYRTPMWFPPIV